MLVSGGCLSPRAVQWPTCYFPTKETQRRAAQIQDPYPDRNTGPDMGFRPLGYQTQRSEPQETRDRYYSSFLKSHFGGPQPVPQTSAAPMLGPRYAGSPGAPQYAQPMFAPQQLAMPGYGVPVTAGVPVDSPGTVYPQGTVSAPVPAYSQVPAVMPGTLQ